MKPTLPSIHSLGSQIVELNYVRPLFSEMKIVDSSESASTILREIVDPKRIDLKEFFWVMLLTNANRLLVTSEVSVGCTKGVSVNIKEVFQLALLTNASAMIVAHNHPSGKLKPSNTDLSVTKKFKKFAPLVEITLLDHIILTTEGYLSLADERLI